MAGRQIVAPRAQHLAQRLEAAGVDAVGAGAGAVGEFERMADDRHRGMIFCDRMIERGADLADRQRADRSEEHTSELQSLMRISYAVFCLKKKTNTTTVTYDNLTQELQSIHNTQPHKF